MPASSTCAFPNLRSQHKNHLRMYVVIKLYSPLSKSVGTYDLDYSNLTFRGAGPDRYAERFCVTGHIHSFARHNDCYYKLSDDDQLLIPELMTMASHQTFSGQLWHLTDQTKFDQTNLLYIINGEVSKFTIGKQISGQFSTVIISTVILELIMHYPRIYM